MLLLLLLLLLVLLLMLLDSPCAITLTSLLLLPFSEAYIEWT